MDQAVVVWGVFLVGEGRVLEFGECGFSSQSQKRLPSKPGEIPASRCSFLYPYNTKK